MKIIRTIISLFLAGCLIVLIWGIVPISFYPWTPLDIMAPATPLTWLKLRLLASDNLLCQAALRTSPFRDPAVPDELPHGFVGPGGPGACSLTDAVRVRAGPVVLLPSSFLASCPLAVDWAMFVVHVVQPTATQIFGRPVVRINHLGSYACRDIADTDEISAHATANALDAASFQLASMPPIAVSDWNDQGRQGQFLHEVRDGACRYFGMVLSPDFNRAHAGHFHLQATGFGFCS
jgi:hypothetical protein